MVVNCGFRALGIGLKKLMELDRGADGGGGGGGEQKTKRACE